MNDNIEDAKVLADSAPSDEQAALDERNRIAREDIDRAAAMWKRRQAALAPLPRVGAMEALHAGLRERVATSVFQPTLEVPDDDFSKQLWSGKRDMGPYIRIPSIHSIQPLPDNVIAALVMFLRRRQRAMSGNLIATGAME